MAVNRDNDILDFDDLLSVREAAKLLRVSESTVWRWIDSGRLKAYKLGPKRVCLRRTELGPILRPVGPTSSRDISQYLSPMSPGPKESADVVIARARALQEKILARRGGQLLPESWIDINEARDERSKDL